MNNNKVFNVTMNPMSFVFLLSYQGFGGRDAIVTLHTDAIKRQYTDNKCPAGNPAGIISSTCGDGGQ